ncbi:uncharacterized protein LDX57_001133 [Aspergillus melleus]|uniref:uncharacterized protein n=1 Tax=Aspergillus melleus TaxID=138277 RepID=UPI001E8DA2FE|nr:uncharacterized protein LDX57_001133 [Aspergillus melleus]KAH8423375.1 hypothetical protein LDX57_001133 [Aspergillus melleus]
MPRTPQFASTPRFLLSQRGPPSSSFSASRPLRPEAIDEDDFPQNKPLAKRVRGRIGPVTPVSATRQTGTLSAARTRDVIEDSDEESGLSAGEVDSELEAEYEALFGETRSESRSMAKRRRVNDKERGNDDGDEEEEGRNKSVDADKYDYERKDNASAHEIGIDIGNVNEPEPDPEPEYTQDNPNEDPDPTPYSDENIPSSPLKPPSTPYPNIHRPRFLLSASSQPHTPSQAYSPLYPQSSTKQHPSTNPSEMTPAAPPSTAPATAMDSTMAPPPSTRRKPTFVLPRSPSPDTAADDFPSLFSPSRTQRRRGRPRGSGQEYVAGGMAEQVRGWILEMGVKSNYRSGHGHENERGDGGSGGLDEQKYAFFLRANEVKKSTMGSCGELVFVRGVDGKEVGGKDEDEDRDGGDGVVRNVLLMGAPQSHKSNPETKEGGEVADLQQGDLIGVGRGLVWDVELDAMGESVSGEREKWSVCMEWDRL